MRGDEERRKHRRLPLRLGVCCQKVGSADGDLFRGDTVNISTGGVLIESTGFDKAQEGDLFNVDFEAPPAEDTFEFRGKFSGFARVVRIIDCAVNDNRTVGISKKHMALEFCSRPKLAL